MKSDSKKIALFGSTGSIGKQALKIIAEHADRYTVTVLSANSNYTVLAEQIRQFKPEYAVFGDMENRNAFERAVGDTKTNIIYGNDALGAIARDTDYDVLLNSLVGFSGFQPTYEALLSGKRVALANKESLVVAGELLKPWLGRSCESVIPVDSEHSAILQCLVGEGNNEIEKLTITASGGPFRQLPLEKLKEVTVDAALKHPNWDMGSKITIDSATMMNKGLEIIEAFWLFNLPLEKIEAVIHPQSIIHSMVTFRDGSVKAQLGIPDMGLPIQYALSYPDRWFLGNGRIDWSKLATLSFEAINLERYPCYHLALQALKSGGFAPVVLNAANEVAVQRFLNREIPYIAIPRIIEQSLGTVSCNNNISVEAIIEVDAQTRQVSERLNIK